MMQCAGPRAGPTLAHALITVHHVLCGLVQKQTLTTSGGSSGKLDDHLKKEWTRVLVLALVFIQQVNSCLLVSSPYYLQIKLVRTALYILLRPSLNFKLEAIFSLIRMITKLLLIREQVFLLTMNQNYHSLVHKRNSNNHPPLKQIQEQSKQFYMNTAHRDNFSGRFW